MMADRVNQAFSSENFSFRDLHSSNSSTRVVLRSMSLLNVFLNRKKTSNRLSCKITHFLFWSFCFHPHGFSVWNATKVGNKQSDHHAESIKEYAK